MLKYQPFDLFPKIANMINLFLLANPNGLLNSRAYQISSYPPFLIPLRLLQGDRVTLRIPSHGRSPSRMQNWKGKERNLHTFFSFIFSFFIVWIRAALNLNDEWREWRYNGISKFCTFFFTPFFSPSLSLSHSHSTVFSLHISPSLFDIEKYEYKFLTTSTIYIMYTI